MVVVRGIDPDAPIWGDTSRILVGRIGIVDLDFTFDRERASIRPGVALDKDQEMMNPN